jgi:hypothetical protein
MADAARIAPVVQRLRTRLELHGRELQALAEQLDATGAKEVAERLRVSSRLHAEEVGAAIRELADLVPPGEDPNLLEDEPQPLTRRELLNLGDSES